MMARSDIDDRLIDEALAWQRALEQDDADWDGYTLWLAADPRHREAFDEVALIDRVINERAGNIATLAAIEPVEIPGPAAHGHGRRWVFGAVAAALAVAVSVPLLRSPPPDTVYQTAKGERRAIALGGGTAIDLAPASRLVAKGGDPTRLELAQGEAYFAVKHDPSRTLSISAGDYAVTDIGTRFAINLGPRALTVAVAEGHVSVRGAAGDATRVSAGQQFQAGSTGPAHIRSVASGDVGGWRQGRLVYSNAPLSSVAADIERYSGKTVIVDPAIANREFSGVLAIGDGSTLLASLAELMSVTYQETGESVRIRAADR